MQVVRFSALIGSAAGGSPIGKVVKLMEELMDKVEGEQKQEKHMFDKYLCWAENVITQKTKFIAEAEEENKALNSYVKKVKGDEIDFTGSRGEMAAQQTDLKKEQESIRNERAAKKDKFETKRDDLKETISLLKDATEEIKAGQPKAGFMQNGVAVTRVFMKMETELSQSDAMTLRKASNPDYEKLNKKSTFNTGFKTQAGPIVKLLENLSKNTKESLKKLKTDWEADTKELDTRKNKADGDLSQLEDKIDADAEENGAQQNAIADAEATIKKNTKNIKTDNEIIETTQKDRDELQIAHDKRQQAMTTEMAAIDKAKGILWNDEARENASKSFASQEAASFLQTSRKCTMESLPQRVSADLVKSSGLAVYTAAVQLKTASKPDLAGAKSSVKGVMDKLVAEIRKLVTQLKTDQKSDYTQKEDCEQNLLAHASTTRDEAIDMDKQDQTIMDNNAKIDALLEAIAQKYQTIKESKEALQTATDNRKEENEEFLAQKKIDTDAKNTIVKAGKVLKDVYKKLSEGSFVQVQAQPVLEAGVLPPPPPQPKRVVYEGSSTGGSNIISLLAILAQDVENDMKNAQSEEASLEKAFLDFKTKTNEAISDLDSGITQDKAAKGKAGSESANALTQRQAAHKNKQGEIQLYSDERDFCFHVTSNFGTRKVNRDMEIDGLKKAIGLLSGAKFANPNRDMAPGDALLLQGSC